MSFCDDLSLLMSLVSPITDGPFVSLLELKFIQCKAVNDDFLALVAKVVGGFGFLKLFHRR